MELNQLSQAMDDFVTSKGWYNVDSPRPQTPRNLAISLNLEATEILEFFQWNDNPVDPAILADELADVSLYLLQLARITGIDLEKAILEKLEKNRSRSWGN